MRAVAAINRDTCVVTLCEVVTSLSGIARYFLGDERGNLKDREDILVQKDLIPLIEPWMTEETVRSIMQRRLKKALQDAGAEPPEPVVVPTRAPLQASDALQREYNRLIEELSRPYWLTAQGATIRMLR